MNVLVEYDNITQQHRSRGWCSSRICTSDGGGWRRGAESPSDRLCGAWGAVDASQIRGADCPETARKRSPSACGRERHAAVRVGADDKIVTLFAGHDLIARLIVARLKVGTWRTWRPECTRAGGSAAPPDRRAQRRHRIDENVGVDRLQQAPIEARLESGLASCGPLVRSQRNARNR